MLNSGSVQVSACIYPQSCDPLGPQLTTQIEATLSNPNNPLLEQSCVVNADPRVTASVSGGTWSCAGGNLDVSTLCPSFPSTVLPGSLCGHSGPTGSGFVVVKSTAVGVDTDKGIVNAFIQNTVQPDLPLPGLLNLQCPTGQAPSPLVQVQIYAWAPRSDLFSVEGTIPEWTYTGGSSPTWTGPQTPYFMDSSGFCDSGGGNSRVLSMASYGLGLNVAGLPAGGLPQFVEDKFANLIQTITIASAQITDSGTTLKSVNQAKSYFNDGNGDPNDYDCAMNTLATADAFVRANPSFFSGAVPPGNPNPAGDIDGRLGNLYLTIGVDFLLQPANATWPPASVPTCITLSSITLAPAATIPAGGTQQLTVTGNYSDSTSAPLPPTASVTWSSGNPTVATVTGGGLVTCLSSAPPILNISVSPPSSMAGAAGTDSLTATGSYSYAPVQISAVVTAPAGPVQGAVSVTCLAPTPSKDLTTLATWASDTTSVATVSSGSVSCVQAGEAGITATYGGVMSPAASVTCPTPVLQSIAVTPQSPPEIEHGSLQLTATGRYSYGPTKNLTNGLVTWASSAPKVATVTAAGAVSCTTPPTSWFDGVATISATLGGVTGSTKVTCDGRFSE